MMFKKKKKIKKQSSHGNYKMIDSVCLYSLLFKNLQVFKNWCKLVE